MKERSHTFNSIVNSLTGVFSSAITIILNFVVRVIIVRELGEEINGLHSLFQSIASVMTLMELGISSAMVIHLYEPVKNNDEKLVKGIMSFYRQLYARLSGVFILVSVLIDFFVIKYLVQSTVPLKTIQIYFLVFAMSYSLHYLTYYKRSLLYADQKNRVSIAITTVCELLFRSAQILILVLYQNYLVFLIILILEKISINVFCGLYVDKYYPYLVRMKSTELAIENKQSIFNTIKPLMVNQVSSTVQQSAKSVLISLLLGNISVVGYFANYQLITNAIQLVYTQFGGAFTASFGHLSVSGNKSQMRHAYLKTAFVLNLLTCVFSSGYAVCVQDFIQVVFGDNFVLPYTYVIILTVEMAAYLLSVPIVSMQNSLGIHKLDAKWMIFQAVFAVSLGYGLGSVFGMTGILIGVTSPLIICTLLHKGMLICENAVDISRTQYIKFVFKEITKVFIAVSISLLVCESLPLNISVGSFILKGTIGIVLGFIVPCILEFKNELLHELYNDIVRLIKRLLKQFV